MIRIHASIPVIPRFSRRQALRIHFIQKKLLMFFLLFLLAIRAAIPLRGGRILLVSLLVVSHDRETGAVHQIFGDWQGFPGQWIHFFDVERAEAVMIIIAAATQIKSHRRMRSKTGGMRLRLRSR